MIPIIYIIVGIIIVIGIFMFLKTDHAKNRVFWAFIIFVAIILIIGFLLSVAGRKIDYNSTEGIQTAAKLYMSWFAQSFNNFKTLTGQAIKMDWDGNDSIVTKYSSKSAGKK